MGLLVAICLMMQFTSRPIREVTSLAFASRYQAPRWKTEINSLSFQSRPFHISALCGSGDANEDSPSSMLDRSGRENRKLALHLRLQQLGVDGDALAEAAFRSVATTGDCILISYCIQHIMVFSHVFSIYIRWI